MNNLNEPPRWNIQPNPREGGVGAEDGNKWNYALLLPLLGLAAFRWIWTRESQKEIQEVKAKHDSDLSTFKNKMETSYRATLTERCKEVATLELELEKERQRVEGYKQAIASNRLQLEEERKKLKLEYEALEGEKKRVVKSGAAAAVLHQALEKENDWYSRATATLKELEGQLVERQYIYCSHTQPRNLRKEMEEKMLLKVVRDPVGRELDLETNLRDIFRKDTHCAEFLNMDKRKNGSLMWVYLKYWQLQITVQKYKRAEAAILGEKNQSDLK